MRDGEHLQRVRTRTAWAIREYCQEFAGATVHLANMTQWVQLKCGPLAPDSVGRIFRDLRSRGEVKADLVDRRQSLYRIGPRFHEEPSGQLSMVPM